MRTFSICIYWIEKCYFSKDSCKFCKCTKVDLPQGPESMFKKNDICQTCAFSRGNRPTVRPRPEQFSEDDNPNMPSNVPLSINPDSNSPVIKIVIK